MGIREILCRTVGLGHDWVPVFNSKWADYPIGMYCRSCPAERDVWGPDTKRRNLYLQHRQERDDERFAAQSRQV